MKRLSFIIVLLFLLVGCASKVKFIQLDEIYVRHAKLKDAEIIYTRDDFDRPYRVIGVLHVKVDLDADESEYKELFIKKARKIGADGVALGKYTVDVDAKFEKPYRFNNPMLKPTRDQWVSAYASLKVSKIVTAVAVVFEESRGETK